MIMSISSLVLVIMLSILIFLSIASHLVNCEHHCSRAESRKVRKFVTKEILSMLPPGMKPESLPTNCILNPRFDYFSDQENHKVMRARNEWECGYCRKTFKNEFYLDRHMDNKHPDKLMNESSLCLADYCNIFHCDAMVLAPDGSDHVAIADKIIPCTTIELEKAQYKCRLIMSRCFGNIRTPGSPVALADELYDRVCRPLHCENGRMQSVHRDNSQEYEFSWWLIQVVFMVLLFFGAALYGCFTTSLTLNISLNSDQARPKLPTQQSWRRVWNYLRKAFRFSKGVKSA